MGGIVEANTELLELFSEKYTEASTYQNLNDALGNSDFAGFTVATPAENHYEIAKKINNYTNCKIKMTKQTKDPRSYRQDSSKLLKTGFKPKFNVDMAIKELITCFKLKKIKISQNFFRVKFMKKKKIA